MSNLISVITVAGFANQNPISNVIGVWEQAFDAQEHVFSIIKEFVALYSRQQLSVTLKFNEGTNPEGFSFIAWEVVAEDSNQKLHEIKITTLPFV